MGVVSGDNVNTAAPPHLLIKNCLKPRLSKTRDKMAYGSEGKFATEVVQKKGQEEAVGVLGGLHEREDTGSPQLPRVGRSFIRPHRRDGPHTSRKPRENSG